MQAFRAIISRHHTHITHITITVDCVDWFIICVFYLSIYHVYVMKMSIGMTIIRIFAYLRGVCNNR